MIEKKLQGMSPTKLRFFLIGIILIIIIVIGVGFWLFRSYLVSYAASVNKAAVEANVSANDIQNLKQLEMQLKDDQVAIKRTKNIVADSTSYQYQDQIINDLSLYAKASNVVISGYSFETNGVAASGAAPATTPATAAPAGLKTTSVSITLRTPVEYKSLMRFIHSLELNLTKMQLTGISMTQSAADPQLVTVTPLTIEVYIR